MELTIITPSSDISASSMIRGCAEPDCTISLAYLPPSTRGQVLAIRSVICGVDNWVGMEVFGNSKKKWLSTIDSAKLEESFIGWVREISLMSKGEIAAI